MSKYCNNKIKKKTYKELYATTQEDQSLQFQTIKSNWIKDQKGIDSQSTCAKTITNTKLKSKPKLQQIQFNKEAIIKTFDVTYALPSINFREKQSQQISSFIQDALKQRIKCRCLLLTGMPGAGKTSLAKKILRNVAGIKTIFMNANVSHSEFAMEFSYQLVGNKLRLPQLITYLEKRKAYEKVVVLLDEFDTLFANAPVQFLDIFRIFSNPIEGVSLIATSNSMQMMRNISQKFNLSLPSYKNIVFSPYKIQQIKNIINERVDQVKKHQKFTLQFQDLTLKYISAKIHNLKGGDIRFVLEQMRNILLKTFETNQSTTGCVITFQNASQVLGKLNKSQQIADIMKSLPFQQCLALIAVNKLFQTNDYLQVSKEQVIKSIKSIQTSLKISNQIYDIKDILMYLQVYQFVGIRYKKKQLYVTLKVNSDLIKNAYEDDILFGKYFWNQ